MDRTSGHPSGQAEPTTQYFLKIQPLPMLADGRRGRPEKRRQQKSMGFFLNTVFVW